MAAAEPAAAATPRIAPATRFALALRVRVRAAFACGESGEDCGPVVDGELFFELDFFAAEGGENFFPPRLAAARDGGGEFAVVFLAGAFLDELFFAVEAFFADLAGDFFDADFLGVALFDADFFDDDFFDVDFFDDDFFDDDFFAPGLLLFFDLATILNLRWVRTDGDRTSVPVEKHCMPCPRCADHCLPGEATSTLAARAYISPVASDEPAQMDRRTCHPERSEGSSRGDRASQEDPLLRSG